MIMNNIQIPYDLFIDLVKWHCFEQQDPERQERIIGGLESKVNRMAARQRYAEELSTRNPPVTKNETQGVFCPVGRSE